MKYVIDTSVVAKFYLEGEKNRDIALAVLRDSLLGKIELVAPSLLYYEINGVFAKEGLGEKERDRHFQHLFGLVQAGVLEIVSAGQSLLADSYRMASLDTKGQGYISAYDATFHALAEQQGCDFLTADEKHFRKTEKLVGSVVDLSGLAV